MNPEDKMNKQTQALRTFPLAFATREQRLDAMRKLDAHADLVAALREIAERSDYHYRDLDKSPRDNQQSFRNLRDYARTALAAAERE
jgi:hypothetical protein